MNVLFVNYHDFSSNSAIHIFNLANRLVDLGDDCCVCVPGDPETVQLIGHPRFSTISVEAGAAAVRFRDGAGPTLVHAWTPRENVRRFTESIAGGSGLPYVVHLEDNEDSIVAGHLGVDVADLHELDDVAFDRLPDALSHPTRSQLFVAGAAAVTVVTPSLVEFVPPGVETQEIRPGFEPELFAPQPADDELKATLGLADDEFVLVYAGNVHATNAAEVRSLYLALALLNRRGHRVRLVRLGRTFVDFLGAAEASVSGAVVDVPFQSRDELRRYFALANAFVQPGRSDEFNDYRLPSKLPEFFAMGRPVILPRSNIGSEVVDGRDGLLLSEGHALEIADAVERILVDETLRERLADGARRFALRHFSWDRSALRLAELYTRIAAPPLDEPTVARGAARQALYRHARVEPIAYATVRDFVDSRAHVRELSSLASDLKDVQRPWALKAVVASASPGATVLEIGAGEPHVAAALAELGFRVWVVDPYDGRDGGPSDFREIRERFPSVRFLRGTFPDVLPHDLAGAFDCIYSISVLEHVPLDALEPVCRAVDRLLTPGGTTIHAVDHVHKGLGAAEHRAKLDAIARGLGFPAHELDAVLSRIDDDVETYFLSAEAHELWRGETPYDEFPMRRCVSVHFRAQKTPDAADETNRSASPMLARA